MVAGRSEVTRASEIITNERCLELDEALKQGEYLYGIVPGLRFHRAYVDVPEVRHSNLRVGDQFVSVHHTGCIPEHESFGEEHRTVVVPCPQDVAARCGGCILNCANGEKIVDSLAPINPIGDVLKS